jgi:phosphoribosylaminoimidazole-succinocarboxamide synthase
LSGHAAREYSSGRVICGVQMVEGLKENSLRTNYYPTTKADNGEHDADIHSNQMVLLCSIFSLRKYTRALFQRGTEIAVEG